MKEAFCVWHEKCLRDVAEHEQDACGGNCSDCECLSEKENLEEM